MQPDQPYNAEAERALLGAVLLNGALAYAEVDGLAAGEFFVVRHQWIWDAIGRAATAGNLDLVTVADELEQAGKLAELGGSAYLAQLMAGVPTALHAGDYGAIVRREATRRAALDVLSAAAQGVYSANGDLAEVIDTAAARLDRLTPRTGNSLPIGEAALAWYARLMSAVEGQKSLAVPTGFRDLDRVTGGLNRKELALLAGRPSMGKSSLAYVIAERAARAGYRAGIFSLEDPGEAVVQRLVFARLGLERAGLQPEHGEAIGAAAGRLMDLPLAVCDTSGLGVGELRREAREMARRLGGLDLVVVDHIGYIAHAGERDENRAARIGNTTKGLVRLAKEMDCAVLALVQLTRQSLARPNHEPDLEDLRDSGCQEEDARQVWMLHRPAYYAELDRQPPKDAPQKANVIVRKNTNGPRNVAARLAYVEAYSRFADWELSYGP